MARHPRHLRGNIFDQPLSILVYPASEAGRHVTENQNWRASEIELATCVTCYTTREMTESLCNVALPVPLRTTFTYAVPDTLKPQIQPGSRVLVPFRRKSLVGVVVVTLLRCSISFQH